MILSSIILVVAMIPVSATQEETSNYEFLLSKGYPAYFLDTLSDMSVQKLVEMIGDNEIYEVQVKQ